jgi:hypothetical protein
MRTDHNSVIGKETAANDELNTTMRNQEGNFIQ